MIGFETIGNATVTVFDGLENVLTTDPWINGNPYFGSWGHKYSIPKEQKENILSAKYIWLSHGHPDHIDSASLRLNKRKKFFLYLIIMEIEFLMTLKIINSIVGK